MVVLELDGESPDLGRIALIQRQILDARVGLGNLLQQFDAPAHDDDPVSRSVKGLGQAATDPGTPSGDQNGVTRQLHGAVLSSLSDTCILVAAGQEATSAPKTAET